MGQEHMEGSLPREPERVRGRRRQEDTRPSGRGRIQRCLKEEALENGGG